MRMELGQVEAMVAVVEHGSFSAAARALHLTQPALSRRIASLESATGLRLFHRVDRTVRLTAEGQALLPFLRRIMGVQIDAEAAVAALHGGDSGELQVAALPSMVVTDMAPIVAAFHRAYPQVDLQISAVTDTDEAAKLVAEARCDVALSDLEVPYPGLATVPLRRTTLMAVFPPGTTLSGAGAGAGSGPPVVQAVDLQKHTLVTLPSGTLTRTITDMLYQHVGATPPRVVTTSQRDALVSFALHGVGVTFVPDVMAASAAAAGAVVAVSDAGVTRTVGLVYRAEGLAPTLSAFLEVAARAIAPLPGSMVAPSPGGSTADADREAPPRESPHRRLP
ncbi:LysR family transcriptional regulator [Rhodococcus sp. T2V]|uniref:LysR family transcriptional regulator n=1 Tax=Rhodococcus sp. T2V TaxID=3034164 RepID=UPI0023E2B773|nr:LysR family transcriptional regulator [Rhodococcus sp. T2V]MDF3306240.1 LysR family transcriptional regulator [Rhodococcus sp. T2V]